MKKLYVVFFISFFAVKLYGVRNLLINDSTSVTITITDTFKVSANFEASGATATGTLYRDVNDNSVLDAPDKWVAKFRLIDGSWADIDEQANGVYTENRDPITMIGKFLFYAEDNGVSDTAVIQVNPCSSPYSVSGKVTYPANTPNLFVCVGDTTGGAAKYNCGDFTNSTGAYFISVPENIANRNKILIVVDILGIVQNLMSNQIQNINVTGAMEMNLAMQSLPDTSVIWGTLKDDLNAPITGKALLFAAALGNAGKTGAVASKTNNDGTYRVHLAQHTSIGMTNFYYFNISATLVDQFYPEYLNPRMASATGMNPSPSQINLELKSYRTTNTISGHVLIKDTVSHQYEPLDNIQIDISPVLGTKSGGTYTKTYSDGHYTAYVSDSIPSYYVKITPNYTLPTGYTILEGDTVKRGPGAIDVDFHIYILGIEEKPSPKPLFKAQPNPFATQIILEISLENEPASLQLYDITGQKVLTLTPDNSNGITKFILTEKDKRLPAGIYFYSLKTKAKTYEGKIIKLQ